MAGADSLAEELADIAARADLTIAVAESLTAGNLAAALGAAPDAGQWFRGGVVAYSRYVKHHVLDVPLGPVVCRTAAEAMANGVRKMMDATVSVAVTGAGGPDPQDGHEPGSVWFAVATEGSCEASHRTFDGEPGEVLEQTVEHALRLLHTEAEKLSARHSG
ncbi:CinA family protein [Nocardia higoensis]|uniref:CinA family protein n=1 Tax=Nocardia higoensis TaxID=228599 RepID=A0ABS0DB32_9NOCA|nr:CinA family protein [Nocardia higoensis]MBF6355688.1 CinA family protein [Nocardia higoensis]